MALIDEITRLAEDVARQHNYINSEDETKRVSVIPFIEALGFNTRNLSEVKSEYTADARDKGAYKVDYVVFKNREPIFAIEVKGAYLSLTEDNWDQLRDYYADLDVRFGILTNGKEYRFYTDLKKINIMDKDPFLTLDLLDLKPRLVNELEGFTKTGFDPDRILSSARKLMVFRQIQQEFNQPSDNLVSYFAQTVHPNKLTRADIQRFSPIVRQAWRELVEYEIASRLQAPDRRGSRQIVDSEREPAIVVGEANCTESILEKQVLIPVSMVYRPRGSKKQYVLKGTLYLADNIGRHQNIVEYEGDLLPPSEAAGRALRSVNPGVSNPNGWVYWTFVNPNTGEDEVINLLTEDENLRRQLLRQQ